MNSEVRRGAPLTSTSPVTVPLPNRLQASTSSCRRGEAAPVRSSGQGQGRRSTQVLSRRAGKASAPASSCRRHWTP